MLKMSSKESLDGSSCKKLPDSRSKTTHNSYENLPDKPKHQ